MKPSFVLRHAWREGRSGIRRIGVYMASIALGVGVLVAVHSFRADVAGSVQVESRALLGGDLRLERNRPFSDSVVRVVDSLEAAGASAVRATTLLSMAYAPTTDLARLLQIRAVDEGFPLYGRVRTTPAGRWGAGLDPGEAVVDPAVPIQLGVEVGDSLRLGEATFRIAGTVEGLPTDLGFQTAVGPRVFIRAAELERTGLLGFGSLARHQIFLRLEGPDAAQRLEDRYRDLFRSRDVDFDTAEELAGNLTEGLTTLSRFLGLVGLVALLLGGIGVASAIHVYVEERLDGVAVLRCLGATQRDVFLAYLVQTGGLGFLGGAVGVALGLVTQAVLPQLLAGVLPVDVATSFHGEAVVTGVLAGIWIAAVFALLPLLGLRKASPLQALRRDLDPEAPGGGDRLTVAAYAALGASVLLVSLWQAPSAEVGAGFAAALAVILGLLHLTARGLMAGARRLFPRRAGFEVRHGVANLFRPRNQTTAVTLALGFGVFLVAAVGQTRESVLDRFTLERDASRANLLLFDVQEDQREEVRSALREAGAGPVSLTPILPAELATVEGRSVTELLADTTDDAPRRWVLTRLYRHTFRDTLTTGETVVAGEWWESPSPPGSPARISLENDLASDLRVGVGDRLTWDFQGRRVESVVTSLRTVDWSRFQPNFFVVFEPGSLEGAPRTYVALTRVPDDESRVRLQGALARAFPNVSILDLARVQETLDAILGRASDAVRFLAGFSVAAGLLVLAGALSTTRFRRMREGALLRTLGAREGQLTRVVLSEFLVLGVVAGAAGVVLGAGGGWLVVREVFELDFILRPLPLLGVLAGTAALTVAVGLLSSRRAVRSPPLEVLRNTLE